MPNLAAYRRLLPRPGGRRVALLVDAAELDPAAPDPDEKSAADKTTHGKSPDPLEGLWAELATDDVYLVTAREPSVPLPDRVRVLTCADLAEASARLLTVGPLDLVVDLLPASTEDEQEVWRALFLHLRPGGVYALANRRPPRGEPPGSGRVDRQVRRAWLAPDLEEPLDGELLASCGGVFCDRSVLLLTKQQQHYLMVREHEVTEVLATRNTATRLEVLQTRAGGVLTSQAEVVSHRAAVPITGLDQELAYPELHVHHYQGRLAMVRNSLLYGASEVLPGSFRYPLLEGLRNPRLRGATAELARVPAELRPRRKLAGHFYHLDCWNTGHFGHVITEVVSRLWGWPAAKAAIPELKAIFRRRQPDDPFPALEVSLFTAYGIDRSDIVWVDEPVQLESVVTATPMWQNEAPYFVHPDIADTWRRLRAGLVQSRPSPRRIFVSRRPRLTNRSCRNVAEVEEVFRRHGFTVVYPDELSFTEQATVFGHAEVVAGFAGSGLYNVLYSERLTTFLVLSQEAYTARYEHLYSMVLGCTTHYFWSTPDIAHPVDDWSEEAYYSSWEFDFARNGAALEQTLAELPDG